MVERIFRFLYSEVRGLHEAAYLLGFFALLSQILALVRDRMLAHSFGAGEMLDLYYAAFRIPDFIFVGIASLVSAYVLIPFITERLENKEELRRLINSTFSLFSVLIVVVSGAVYFALPYLLPIAFPGFTDGAQDTLLVLSRIMLLQPILLGLSSFFGSFTQSHHKFVLFGVTPLLYNFGIILGILYLYPVFGIQGLVYGVVLGAFLHMAIQLPFIIRNGYLPTQCLAIDRALVQRVLFLSLPRTLTLSMNQFVLLTLMALGSLLVSGSVSVFNFSFNLQSVPLAIIGASYSVAAFPTLARLFSEKAHDQFVLQVATALRHIVFWSVPAIVFFVVLRAQIVRVLLGSGAFDWSDTRLTAAALALFVLSLSAQAVILLLVRAFYASQKTWTPFWIAIVSSVVSINSALALLSFFTNNASFRNFVETLLHVEGIVGTEVLMLAAGYSIGMVINALLLIFFFQRQFGEATRALASVFFGVFALSIASGWVSYLLLQIFSKVFDLDTFI